IESVRRRIPGASDGLWTHHGPVDPGITLLELFAWLIEQRLFWIDQVPDETTRALFALLGEQTLPPTSAATVLACTAPPGAAFHELRAGVEFGQDAVDTERVFTTRTAAVLLPVARLGLSTAEGDRSADLRSRKAIALLGNDGGPSQFVVVLWLAAPPPPSVPGKLALLFHLDVPGTIVSE